MVKSVYLIRFSVVVGCVSFNVCDGTVVAAVSFPHSTV